MNNKVAEKNISEKLDAIVDYKMYLEKYADMVINILEDKLRVLEIIVEFDGSKEEINKAVSSSDIDMNLASKYLKADYIYKEENIDRDILEVKEKIKIMKTHQDSKITFLEFYDKILKEYEEELKKTELDLSNLESKYKDSNNSLRYRIGIIFSFIIISLVVLIIIGDSYVSKSPYSKLLSTLLKISEILIIPVTFSLQAKIKHDKKAKEENLEKQLKSSKKYNILINRKRELMNIIKKLNGENNLIKVLNKTLSFNQPKEFFMNQALSSYEYRAMEFKEILFDLFS